MIRVLVCALVLCAPAAVMAQDAPTPERALKKCRICHGGTLLGKKKVPPIAGLRERRVLKALTSEVPKLMRPIVAGLSEAEKKAVATFLSQIQPRVPAGAK